MHINIRSRLPIGAIYTFSYINFRHTHMADYFHISLHIIHTYGTCSYTLHTHMAAYLHISFSHIAHTHCTTMGYVLTHVRTYICRHTCFRTSGTSSSPTIILGHQGYPLILTHTSLWCCGMYVCACVCTYICEYVCMCVCMYMHALM
jgi:hypothetical protein